MMGKRDADAAELDESYDVHASSLDLHSEVFMKLKQLYETTPVQDGDLQDATLNMLCEFDVDTQLKILDEFGNSNFSRIRSKDGYFRKILQKKRQIVGNYDHFPVRVQQLLDDLYDRGVLKLGDLDDRCMEALQALDENQAIRAIEKLTNRSLNDIRNMSAFFMAQIKQVEKESRDYIPNTQMYDNVGMSGQYPPQGAEQVGIYPPAYNGGIPPVVQPGFNPGVNMMQVNPARGAVGLRHYGVEQASLGIRVNEFHNLSQFAAYVHPAAALKLQQLWDSGVKLVALLDAQSWEALANTEGPEALIVIDETANLLESGQVRNVNAFFTSRAKAKINETNARGRGRGRPPPHPVYGEPVRGGRQQDPYGRRDSYQDRSYQRQQAAPYPPARPRVDTRDRQNVNSVRSLPDVIRDKIDSVIYNHSEFISESNFDPGVVQALVGLPEDKALQVLSQLDERDLSCVRNVSGYIIGICRTMQKRG